MLFGGDEYMCLYQGGYCCFVVSYDGLLLLCVIEPL